MGYGGTSHTYPSFMASIDLDILSDREWNQELRGGKGTGGSAHTAAPGEGNHLKSVSYPYEFLNRKEIGARFRWRGRACLIGRANYNPIAIA